VPLFSQGGGSAVLTRILISFARLFPQLSYVQGMSSLAATVLIANAGKGKAAPFLSSSSSSSSLVDQSMSATQHSSDGKMMMMTTIEHDVEVDTFWTFAALVMNRLSGYFEEGMSALLEDTARLQLCLQSSSSSSSSSSSRTETLSNILKEIDFDWLLLTPDWFLQVFCSESCDSLVTLHIWDLLMFLHESEPIMVSASGGGSGVSGGIVETTNNNGGGGGRRSVSRRSTQVVQKSTVLPSSTPSLPSSSSSSHPIGRVTMIWVVVGLMSKFQNKYIEFHETDKNGLSVEKCCEGFRSDLLSIKSLSEISMIISLDQVIALYKSVSSATTTTTTTALPSSSLSRRSKLSKSPSANLSRSAARKKAAEKAAEDRVVVARANTGFFKMNFM
jgi:hypothetical protein